MCDLDFGGMDTCVTHDISSYHCVTIGAKFFQNHLIYGEVMGGTQKYHITDSVYL
jgi:hypothetical protein